MDYTGTLIELLVTYLTELITNLILGFFQQIFGLPA